MNKLLFGFANSMFQSSFAGDCGLSNWTNSMKNNKVTQSDVKISHWNNFKNDILQMKDDFNVTTYRISIEWSHIEPTKGNYDHAILMKYKEIAEYCLQLNIEPMFTLHHFTEPLWFSEMGGFIDENNLVYFVEFCMYVYSNLHTVVKLWCTFNEPAVYAFMGYLLGQFPPHNTNLQKTLIVLKNLLCTHVEIYHKLKAIDETCQIGIVHNVLIFKQLYMYDILAYGLASFLNPITNDLVIEFLKTGKFSYVSNLLGIDIKCDITKNFSTLQNNDFIGLNFYANPVVGPNVTNIYGPTHFNNQEMGDMFLPLDAKGFGNAIDMIATLDIPIYITEIGIAYKTNDDNDELRKKFVIEYVDMIESKINEGANILGCYFWTFRDNYEWNQKDKCFGFHDIDGNSKKSCKILKDIILINLLEYEESTICHEI